MTMMELKRVEYADKGIVGFRSNKGIYSISEEGSTHVFSSSGALDIRYRLNDSEEAYRKIVPPETRISPEQPQ